MPFFTSKQFLGAPFLPNGGTLKMQLFLPKGVIFMKRQVPFSLPTNHLGALFKRMPFFLSFHRPYCYTKEATPFHTNWWFIFRGPIRKMSLFYQRDQKKSAFFSFKKTSLVKCPCYFKRHFVSKNVPPFLRASALFGRAKCPFWKGKVPFLKGQSAHLLEGKSALFGKVPFCKKSAPY